VVVVVFRRKCDQLKKLGRKYAQDIEGVGAAAPLMHSALPITTREVMRPWNIISRN
jgi:hypothetical protein